MEWSIDVCIVCEGQIQEGNYFCSERCRLAEMEKPSHGGPQTSSNLSSSASSTSSSSHGFYLPPAVNFSAYKSPTTSSSRGFDMGPSSSHAYYSTATSTSSAQSQQRSLSPSSSRSSLSSAASQSATGLSHHAAAQLSGYVRSFDQVRETKRRIHY
ncbi:hypothetical protein B0J11DRAFT_433927 [Dendryphion nanum]|uniref:Uncharacterized protein n=1 Tax=Dendryphion nanum TaxID=256645 RepID=A0A9P9DT60_9PLEO|nr:hypothetical protein B0J11DRAFT_433927 [Dendryphion nanum]